MKRKNILLLTFLGMFLAACHQNHNHHHDHDHDHDEVKLFLTAYDDVLEVFAEADPFATGVTSELLVHLTWLETFKPVTHGRATLSMAIGDQGIRQTQDQPLKPGVFRFQLQPQAMGMARVFLDVETNGQSRRIELGNYRVYDDAHVAFHAAEDLMPDHPTAIHFSKEHSWLVDFATGPVREISMGTVIKTVGEIQPMQGDEIRISAQTSGIVRFVSNSLYEGTALQASEVLLHVSGEALAENNATLRYQQAQSNYQRARADFERISALAEENIASQRELGQARNEYETAAAAFEMLSRNFSEKGQVVRSPFAGSLTRLFVSNGEYVETGQPLARITREGYRIVRAEVQTRYAPWLPQLAEAHFRDPLNRVFTLSQLNGVFLSRATSANEQSHLLPVVMKIQNLPHWVNGSLVDVFLKTSSQDAVIAVPNTALVEEQGYFFAFVQIHPEMFEKRLVKTGVSDGIHTHILEGLTAGERIVTLGARMVKMAAAAGEIDPHSGHVH